MCRSICSRVLLAIGVLGSSVLTAHADTILSQDAVAGPGDHGSYQGAFWKMGDTGFALTGDPLTDPVLLKSVTFTKGAAASTGDATQGDLYLKVYTGNTGGLGTFVGASTNTVNVWTQALNAPLTWNFNSLSLSQTATYSYLIGLTNDSGYNVGDSMGLQVPAGNPLTSCDVFNNDGGYVETGYEPNLRVTLASVPEPASLSMMLSCVSALLVYAWRKRS